MAFKLTDLIFPLGNKDVRKFAFGEKQKKVPTMTPQQQQVLDQILSMLNPQGAVGQGYGESLDLLRQYLDPSSEAVQQFTEPYMQQFEQETVPKLAERFAGLGGGMGGGLSSSGFGQSLSAAGSNLQTQLAALKAALGQQASQQLMGQYGNLAQQGLGASPFAYQQGSPGILSGLLSGYAQAGFPGLM